MLVDGAVAKNYPVSYGRNTDDPELETRSGTHVVQEKFDSFTMCNPKYGYCGFIANWAVRISNNGEFIHENAAVIDSLGNANVSHGCVNMSPADAKDFYDNALYGDPVEVTGTSTQLSPADGDIFDWTYDYDTVEVVLRAVTRPSNLSAMGRRLFPTESLLVPGTGPTSRVGRRDLREDVVLDSAPDVTGDASHRQYQSWIIITDGTRPY